MAEPFDPYHKWLGIPPKDQPPTHYRLLRLERFESDPDVIESAADRQMAHLRLSQTGPHSALSQKLLNEVAAAKRCLLEPERKHAYDEALRAAQPSDGLGHRTPVVVPQARAAVAALPVNAPPHLLPSSDADDLADADDSVEPRPIWREPLVIGAALGGLLIGTAIVAVILVAFMLPRVEEGQDIASAGGEAARREPKSPLNGSPSEASAAPAARRVGSDSAVPMVRAAQQPFAPARNAGDNDDRDRRASKKAIESQSAPAMSEVEAAASQLPARSLPAPPSPVAPPPPIAPQRQVGSTLAVSPGADNSVPQPAPATPVDEQQPDDVIRIKYKTIGKPVDLLKGIVPSRDAVHGEWRRAGDAVVSPEQLNWARLQLSAKAPPEYIVTVEISNPAQHDNLSLGLVAGGSQFMYCVTAFGKGGLFLLDGKEWHVNETSYPVKGIFHPGPNTVTCIVHKRGIIAQVNDRTLIDWEGDFGRLSLQGFWRMPSAQTLFLGTGPRYEFTRVELQAIRSLGPRDRRRG